MTFEARRTIASDAAALRSRLEQLRTALDRFDDELAALLTEPVATGRIEPSPIDASPRRCDAGHALLLYTSPDCPVCTMRRLTGYSEKWCGQCAEITPHVGGLHVYANCVQCLSNREAAAVVGADAPPPVRWTRGNGREAVP